MSGRISAMATRLQFQPTETKTGSATPTQLPAPMETGIVTAPRATTATTTRHTIEPELLGLRPRYIKSKTPVLSFAALAISIMLVLPSFFVLSRQHPERITEIFYAVCLTFLLCSGLQWCLSSNDRRDKSLLKHGEAHTATVISIEKCTGLSHIYATYIPKTGDTMEAVVKIHPEVVEREGLGPRSPFTLLVSPDNPKVTIPYFLASRTFAVIPIEPTQISRDVSVRIAAQIANRPVQSAGRLGVVEPELLDAAPRRVRITSQEKRVRLYVAGMLAAIATAYFAAPLFGLHPPDHRKDAFLFQMCVLSLSLLSVLQGNNRNLLQKGVASRALIIAEEELGESQSTPLEKRSVSFSYQYEWNGVLCNGSFTMRRKRAWQLGIAKNATFTILCDAKDKTVMSPYFQITSFEIVGATGAKITPP